MRRQWAAAAAVSLVVLSSCSATRPVATISIRPESTGSPVRVARIGALRVPIFMYHHIGPAPPRWRPLYVALPQFARQMKALAESGAAILSLDELHAAAVRGRAFPRGVAVLTFDDGTLDQFQLAYPILRQYRLRATFYVSPGMFGKRGYLSWNQAKEMSESGLVTFAAHTNTHTDLTEVAPAEARAEILGSKMALERNLGIRVRHFAYPYGHFNDDIVAMVREAGFVTAVTTRYQWSRTHDDALTWGRMMIHDTNKPENLAELARSSGSLDS